MSDVDVVEERAALIVLKNVYESRLTNIRLRIKLIDEGLK